MKLKASILLKDNFFIIKSEKKFPSFIIYTIDFFGNSWIDVISKYKFPKLEEYNP